MDHKTNQLINNIIPNPKTIREQADVRATKVDWGTILNREIREDFSAKTTVVQKQEAPSLFKMRVPMTPDKCDDLSLD